ncbi:hypothetical protein [Oceanobacillus alkalisoli]|uniref:hypothetical protein n=1 Tax=Oceanobacillus alkalisoli TaxID=2925113 RepID=UPI001EE47B06|nr:hypothetical protein [Oceanobacillus alkalisoli]MCG5105181.1 hypothetical protein [Oceanobacillus alkalisoli]
MTTDEAMEILNMINEMYPKFNLTKRKAKILIPSLKQMDYTGVLKNLSAHVMHQLYPPMLSEIAAYRQENKKDSSLTEIEKWEEEAKQVTPEMKKHFQSKFEKLLQQKGWN